ncbi:MAG: hypothetical protein MJ165_00470 [Alphaproteobacteria bacterium]|nr:hypothetical protein [Alphaproteobacteria bacterium]
MALNKKYFVKEYWQFGSSMMEVILAIALVLAVTPFLYTQISDMTDMVQDIHYAKKIVGMRNNIITFVRVNESDWEKTGVTPEINIEELQEIAPGAKNMVIDNQSDKTGIIDVYLVFPKRETSIRTAKVAKYIGHDAAVVQTGGIAYAQNWAVQDEKNFEEGDLIFKVSRDYALENKTNYLHREAGVDGTLTTMLTDLAMNNNYMYNVGEMKGDYLDMYSSIVAKVRYLNAADVQADNGRFLSGLNFQDSEIHADFISSVNTLYGFNIEANTVNKTKNVTPLIMGNSVTVNAELKVGNDVYLSYIPDVSETDVIDITSMETDSLSTGVMKAKNLNFYADKNGDEKKSSFGITVAADLWPFSVAGSVKGLTLGDRDRGPDKRGFWNISADGKIMPFNDLSVGSKTLPVIIDINPELLK